MWVTLFDERFEIETTDAEGDEVGTVGEDFCEIGDRRRKRKVSERVLLLGQLWDLLLRDE